MLISSVSNPKIKEILALKDKKGRHLMRAFIAEGAKLIADIPNGTDVSQYILREDFNLDTFRFQPEAEILTVSKSVFDKISDVETPQGIAAVVKIAERSSDHSRNALILDRIRDPGNLGTLLRSAAAFDFFNVLLINCADTYSQKTVRASMGGIFKLNITETTDDAEIQKFIPSDIYRFIGLDIGGEEISGFSRCGDTLKTALIVGSEADGMSDYLSEKCSIELSIGMSNGIESLNAAAAGSIAMFYLRSLMSGGRLS
ncbi:MAG: RNA methyltransferase [Clostridiales bacterium]|jgi:TrmH family RNA methyltransferase|nr:RNA methyltransferase [Clostridiales bacterium]